MKRRRWPWVLLSLLAVLLLADAAAWFAAERALAAGLARWTAALAARGIVATTGPASFGGFPVAARRSFALRLQAGVTALDTGRLALIVSPAAPDRLLVRLPEPVVLAAPAWRATLAAPDWRLQVLLDGTGTLITDARDLTVRLATAGGAPRQARAALLHLQAQPGPDSLDLVGSAQSILLSEPPPGTSLPLGRELASIAFEAVASGRLPPPSGAGTWPDAATLAAWRDSGGALEVRRLALGYGPLGLSGGGRIGLDADLQPQGRATLTVLGYAETLDALVAARALGAHAAQAIGAILGLLAHPPPGGGVPEVSLDVTLQDRVLNAAGFSLLRLPPLAWPAGGA